MKEKITILIVSAILLTFTGCFTGIENTPKITAGDLRRERIPEHTPEQEIADLIKPQSPSEWESGREFIITDERIRLIFPSTDVSKLPNAGDTVYYAGYEAVPSVMGDSATALMFVKKNSADTLVYRIETNPVDFISRKSFIIPFAIDLNLVECADSVLSNKTVYVMTNYWYDANFRHLTGRKFVKAKIESVSAGNSDYPLAVRFIDENNRNGVILMTVGEGKSSTRNFAGLFSLSNPRLRYQNITDDNWNAIVNGRVRQYMTRDEARLALGTPTDVIYGHDRSFSYERWVYPNGSYLIFEDGLLMSYRI